MLKMIILKSEADQSFNFVVHNRRGKYFPLNEAGKWVRKGDLQ